MLDVIPPVPSLRRIRVVGVSGSGKTRFAGQVAQRLHVAHLELDAVFWDADWTHRDLDEARRIVRDFVDAHPEGWVVEGNWNTRLDGLLEPGTPAGADVNVWLDHPRATVMRRIVTRTVRRAVRREQLWHGNRERPSSWLSRDPEHNILLWAWVRHPIVQERMLVRMAEGDPVVRLQGQAAADAWLTTI